MPHCVAVALHQCSIFKHPREQAADTPQYAAATSAVHNKVQPRSVAALVHELCRGAKAEALTGALATNFVVCLGDARSNRVVKQKQQDEESEQVEAEEKSGDATGRRSIQLMC